MPTKPINNNEDIPDTISSYKFVEDFLTTSKQNSKELIAIRKSSQIEIEKKSDILQDLVDRLVVLELDEVASEELLKPAYDLADDVQKLSSQAAGEKANLLDKENKVIEDYKEFNNVLKDLISQCPELSQEPTQVKHSDTIDELDHPSSCAP
jgi:chromosome segregation ATPase